MRKVLLVFSLLRLVPRAFRGIRRFTPRPLGRLVVRTLKPDQLAARTLERLLHAKDTAMASYNCVQLLGNLGADPDTKHVAGDRVVSTFRLATNESWKKDGQEHDSEKG